MGMSRKDYEAIAKVLKDARGDAKLYDLSGPVEEAVDFVLDYVTHGLVTHFVFDNERFDPDRFKAAAK